ncbi:SRPBCC family protein [Gramella sp. MAR_2010_147]|uniref:SRPBCC family protein n=1 Tax=Gramella sp. MAR_2010_147 TaxID=1250205 RepID=UPI00087CF882|nr:SRPBCC family protein [Gramella sp. MAR_2010_147]SDS29074.1 Uncharacterized conserved protein YndB, AHSA1/START domain [Gramella sp. MAR_2010_147]
MATKDSISVKVNIEKKVEKVWEFWTKPEHIIQWNHASEDWLCPSAENDLKKGGKFLYRMEAKDGSFGFYFSGVYKEIKQNEKLVYKLDDNRMVSVLFSENNNSTSLKEVFEPEDKNSVEMQKEGWQAILNNFKKYAESKG